MQKGFVILFLFFLILFGIGGWEGSEEGDDNFQFGVLWNLPKVIPVSGVYGGVVGGSDIYVRLRNSGNVDVNVTVGWILNISTPNITVKLSRNSFTLPAGSTENVYVEISISAGTLPGVYGLTLWVHAQSRVGGNTISKGYEFSSRIIVGEGAYALTVELRKPTGGFIFGLMRVSYIYEGSINRLFEARGYKVTFYVIEGNYRVEGFFGGMLVSKDVYVDRNMSVVLTISPILLDNFEIIETPRDLTDPIIFAVDVINKDPMTFNQHIELFYYLNDSANRSIYERKNVASLTITGKSINRVRGHISSPSEGWSNGSYVLKLCIVSNNATVYASTYVIPIQVIIPPKEIIVRPPSILDQIKFSFLGWMLGFLISYFVFIRKMKARWYKSVKPRIIGVWAQAPLLMYNVTTKSFMDISETLVVEFVPLEAAITSAYNVYWGDLEKAAPVSFASPLERQIFYPVNEEFCIFAFYPLDTYEHDECVVKPLKKLAKKVLDLLEELEIPDYMGFSARAIEFKEKFRSFIDELFGS